jgi:type II secretory pathway pseudopilin PulG
MRTISNPRVEARKSNAARAFTMIEIALSVAIVSFALVAILGVLPTGMRVQKDNREDTVIRQDGLFLLDAIRSSTRTLDELTNYVESITLSNILKQTEITNFASGEEVIGLLTTLKNPLLYSSSLPAGPRTFVNARMRSMTGAAGDKGNKTNEFAFRYQVEAETIPIQIVPPVSIDNLRKTANSLTNGAIEKLQIGEEIARMFNLNNYMFDVRLTLRWPVYQVGDKWRVGRYRKTFRTLVTGTLSTNRISSSVRNLTFVVPNTFTNYAGTNNFFSPYVL